MLYIFDNTETLIATLSKDSFFDAVHYEVLNGENTFEFTVPAGSEYVVEGNLVAFRDLDSYWQVFEVKRLVDSHGDGLTRTAYCEHIFYELLDDIVTDKRPSADATAALAGMLDGTRWQVGIVDDLGASSTSAYYVSALEAVQKVANAWKGELNWRCVIQGGVITRYVDLLAMRGTDTGKQFAYSKDILSIEREVDSSGVVTALYGRGKGIELDSGSYGRRLTFADVEAPGKPLGQEWIGDNEALAQWGRPGGRHRFDVFIDEEETDPVKLLEKTKAELDRRKVPRVTYRLDVVSLEQLTGYEHEKVRLGDMVRVIDREFKPELVVSARVIDIERDILDPANTKVVLGSFAPTIVEATINTARRVNEMANKPYNTKWLDGKISVLQNAIENTQSYVFQTGEDGILILDAPTYDQATKAMKLGGGIFAIANQKDGVGGWNWRTFGDGSGFTADLITAGIIDAGLVQIGSATTFEAGYDPTQITADSVGMGVDADCLGLWHFDGSLNSHKGVAVDSDDAFDTGCFGQAVKVEEGTTNLFVNPFFTGTYTGGLAPNWTKVGTCTLSENTNSSFTVYGGKSQHVSDMAQYGGIGQDLILTAGATYTITVYCYIVKGSSIVFQVNDGTWKTSYINNKTGWQKASFTFTASQTNVRFYIQNANADTAEMYVDAVQIEAKPYTTPFVDGTRLGVLKAPTAGLSASQGTTNFRAKNLSASADGSVLVDLPKSDNTQGILAGISSEAGHEGELFITGFGSDFTGSKIYSADSVWDAAYSADKAFDNNESTRWNSQSGIAFPHWLKVDLGTNESDKKTARKLRLKPFVYNGNSLVRDFKLQGSNDDTNWIDIYSSTAENKEGWQEFTFSNASNYRYYRLYITSPWDTGVTTSIWEIELMEATTVYGPNKSTLTGWDSISLAWKPERLSLVVNDEEACYIENPGLPASLGSHVFIGTDRNGVNAINTLVDELRVDKVYREVDVRTAWHKTGTPFYTSEDMKQWPGHIKIVTDGVEVYDSEGNLRVKLGSWLKDLIRKYGLKVHDGEIYSSIVRSGAEDADTYIQLMPPNKLQVYNAGKKQLEIDVTTGGRVQFFYNDVAAGEIKGTSNTDILVWTLQKLYLHGQQGVEVTYDLKVNGDLTCTGAKPAQQVTDNYGLRYMYATEAPELVYYDRGQGRLANGECTIYLDPIYLECIELDTKLTPWQIWVQCYGENDVYVSEVGANYFKIKERNGGTSNNKVVWKHEAIRKNYAGIRLMEVVD